MEIFEQGLEDLNLDGGAATEETVATTEGTATEGTATATVEEAPKTTGKVAKAKDPLELEKQALLIARSKNDPQFQESLNKYSENIEVIGALGFGDSGNFMVDKLKPVKDNGKANLVPTSEILGYIVVNHGTEAIPYRATNWKKNEETGEYEAVTEQAMFEPGVPTRFTKSELALMSSIAEISHRFRNGILKVKNASSKSFDELINSYFFNFSKDKNEDGNTFTRSVHDDEFKKAIAKKDADGKWHVKEEYLDKFGYLENPDAQAANGSAKGKKKYTAQEVSANYIFMKAKEEGIL